MIAPLVLGLLIILVFGILVAVLSPRFSVLQGLGVAQAVIALLLLLQAGPFK